MNNANICMSDDTNTSHASEQTDERTCTAKTEQILFVQILSLQ